MNHEMKRLTTHIDALKMNEIISLANTPNGILLVGEFWQECHTKNQWAEERHETKSFVSAQTRRETDSLSMKVCAEAQQTEMQEETFCVRADF